MRHTSLAYSLCHVFWLLSLTHLQSTVGQQLEVEIELDTNLTGATTATNTGTTAESTTTTTTATTTRGNCLCQNHGALLRDVQVDQLPASYWDLLPTNTATTTATTTSQVRTCGDIQDLYSEDECPEASWMSFCCSEGPPQDVCAQQVRTIILSNYDKAVIPTTSTLTKPVNVTVQMIYHTVTRLDETQGTMDIFVWLILKWKDERLSWTYDAAPNSTCTRLPIQVRAQLQQGLKDSEIWVPDFDLFNQIAGVTTMNGPMATVDFEGHVSWLRQGHLKAICQMEGLGAIPYDQLTCQLLMGSQYSALHNFGVHYQLEPTGGIKTSNYAGPYNGYRLTNAEPGIYHEPDGRQFVFFNLVFARGTSFYSQNIIVPAAIFAYCSLLTIVVGVGAFQTLALNFTLLLTSVTQKIATSNMLPRTNENLWIVDFVFGSFYFILYTIAETFLKFIILEMRHQHHQKQPTDNAEVDPEEEDHHGRTKSAPPTSWYSLPPWFYTFSLRRMDVMACWIGVLVYTIFIIVTFTGRNRWGSDIQFPHVTNETAEL